MSSNGQRVSHINDMLCSQVNACDATASRTARDARSKFSLGCNSEKHNAYGLEDTSAKSCSGNPWHWGKRLPNVGQPIKAGTEGEPDDLIDYNLQPAH
jgi:hypothetical protein